MSALHHHAFAGFDTTVILSAEEYKKEVLQLEDGESEDDLDQKAAVEAQKLGISDRNEETSGQLTTAETAGCSERYSAITTSSESQSFNSDPSRFSHSTRSSKYSRDSTAPTFSSSQSYFNPRAPVLETIEAETEPPSSPLYYDSAVNGPRPELRSSFSTYSSTSSGPKSPSWLPMASRFGLKRKKGKRTKIYRKDTRYVIEFILNSAC